MARFLKVKDQIREKQGEVCLLFAMLKKLNRLEKCRTSQSREKLHKAKQMADSCHLQLQNLLYEILHLKKEVNKCLQFKSKDEDIDLVSIEEFYRDAPESVTRPEVTRGDGHQLKLARLEWELKQRRQLAKMCEELQADKEKIAFEIDRRKEQLDNLAPMLTSVLNVANPMREYLGMSPAQPEVTQLLPQPLYFLFVQADALRVAGDKKILVKIEGDDEEAKRMKQNIEEAAPLEDSDSDTQEEVVGKRHGHRKKPRVDRQEERKRQLLMAHPLSVVMNITLKDNSSVSLKFLYLVKLHVVTVKPRVYPDIAISSVSSINKLLDEQHLLTELFPEDFGDSSPNLANFYQLNQVGIEHFNTSELGMAYIWAQRLAGLNFSCSGGGEQDVPAKQLVSQNSMPAIVKAIKTRVLSRLALCAQIQALESNELPDLTEVRECFPVKLGCDLQQWTAITWTNYQELGFTQRLVSHGFVNDRDILYKCTLVRTKARCTVAVAIKNCYPLLPPVFALEVTFDNQTIQASNNESIRDIEREVNVYFKEMVEKSKSPHGLLTAQLLRVMTDFNILLEASSNRDFPREKIFTQTNRGRQRAWPFKQVEIEAGIFHYIQRCVH